MSWIEVKAGFEPGLDLSPFIDIFGEHGIENTLEEGEFLTGCLVDVEGSWQRVSQLVEDLREAGAVVVETRDLAEDNWEISWRQFFKPRRIGNQFVVRPTWEEYASEAGDVVIVLDPGQAFGTGDHPTTRLCLELLETIPLEGKNVVDIGCGSGILSVASCLLGASKVTGIDIDPIAVEVAKENMAMNGVEFEAISGEGLTAPHIKWDVVISNIISATLIRIARDVRKAIVDDGRWIVSGIIVDNWPDVLAAARKEGFRLLEKREEDGWVAAVFTC